MQTNVYNIIWVDDEIDTLINMETKRQLKEHNIEIIGKAHNSEEFRDIMKLCYDRVDAVITDANFNRTKGTPKSERDLSGFEDLRTSIEAFNQKREIPFFLYSGRNSFLDEKYEDEELRYFYENDRRFSKGELPEMLDKIVQDVNHINSPIFQIRNKYYRELLAASIIDGNKEFLEKALLYDYNDSWTNIEDFFNPARKVVERIFTKCQKLMIIPPGISELNGVGHFLNHKNNDFKLKDNVEIMPKALTFSLIYFLNITQDGSHSKNEEKLGVDKYIRTTKNANLFRAITYIAMAAYMARYIAKNIVAAGLAERAEVELAYAIGVPFPVSIMVETFGTESVKVEKIQDAVAKVFDCSPAGIVKTLNLKQPIYQKTASYGHFGRDGFPWEACDKVDALKEAVK